MAASMERVRRALGLPRLQLPSLQQLRDGDFWAGKGKEEVSFSWLAEWEAKLARAQEVALWTSPVTSVAWVVAVQALVLHLTTSALLPTVAKLALATLLYCTWVYRVWPAIRVPPDHPEDCEQWTPLHPDVLSAPELDTWVQGTRHRLGQVVSGQALLREEQPGKFCLLSSLLCLALAVLGMQTSTAVLLHTAALLALTLPALLVRGQQVPALAPWLLLMAEFTKGLGDLCVYRGIDAPPIENKDLDEFVPEVTTETESFLEKALSYVQRKDNDEDSSLTADLSLPSPEELELEEAQQAAEELLPGPAMLSLHLRDADSDSECEEELPGQVALPGVEDSGRWTDGEEEEEDMDLDLEQAAGVMGLVTCSVTAVTTTVSSVQSTVSSVTSALLGTFLARGDSEPDLEDFELVSESDLDLESP